MEVKFKFKWGYSILLSFICSFSFAQQLKIDDIFSTYEVIELESNNIFHDIKSNRSGVVSINIRDWEIELYTSEILSSDYKAIGSKGISISDVQTRAVPMEGYTAEGHKVALTIGIDFIYGTIRSDEGDFYIEPLRFFKEDTKNTSFILYNSKDVISKESGTCGFNSSHMVGDRVVPESNTFRNGGCYTIEYGICQDYSMVVKYGNATNAENFAIGVVNDINFNYENGFADELTFVITGQYISTCGNCDPWTTSTNATTLLEDFTDWSRMNLGQSPISIRHDVASLWTNRDFDGSTIGVAWLSQVCGQFKYNILQDFPNATVNTRRVLVAHELGHNFGAGHDSSTPQTIMYPSVNTSNTWSALSKSQIETFYNTISCLEVCTNSPGRISFATNAASVIESQSVEGVGGMCNNNYFDWVVPVTLERLGEGNVNISVSISNESEAEQMVDFELLTPNLTFTQGGNLTQNVTVRIYDDMNEELLEHVILNLNIISGTAIAGDHMQYILTINDDDYAIGECCIDGGSFVYGLSESYFAFGPVFLGNYTDAKTRIILTPAQLTSYGITRGYIDLMSLYIYQKNSTGNFRNFRIGLAPVSQSVLSSSVPYYSTTQVFYNTVSTPASGWINFEFSEPYYWDGISNLYVEFCFDNTSTIRQDLILGFTPTQAGSEPVQFRGATSGNGCSLGSGDYSFYQGIHPVIGFRKAAIVDIETAQETSLTNSYLRVGETANFYSNNKKIMASIRNIGNTDIACVDMIIERAGNGKTSLGFLGASASNKSFYIAADENAFYELTVYLKNGELTQWDDIGLLHFIKSSVPLSAATLNSSTFLFKEALNYNIGSGGDKAFTVTGKGSGYYALTDYYDDALASRIDQADIVFHQTGAGVIVSNEMGENYLITMGGSGNLLALPSPSSEMAMIDNGDVIMSSSLNNLVFRQSSGQYHEVAINNSGDLESTALSSLPNSSIDFITGNFKLSKAYSGIILQNPNGECWKIYVNSLGAVSTTRIACR